MKKRRGQERELPEQSKESCQENIVSGGEGMAEGSLVSPEEIASQGLEEIVIRFRYDPESFFAPSDQDIEQFNEWVQEGKQA